MKAKITTFARIIRTGMVNFVRNLWLAIAAMAIMIITLSIILFSVIVNATFNDTVQQITNKIDVSMYLKDSAHSAADTSNLHLSIKKRFQVSRASNISARTKRFSNTNPKMQGTHSFCKRSMRQVNSNTLRLSISSPGT